MHPFELSKQLGWLECAAALPGRGPVVTALAIVATSVSLGRRTGVQLTPETLQRYGLTRITSYRSLRALEAAGLIEVSRTRGSSPSVTVLGTYSWLSQTGDAAWRPNVDPLIIEEGD